MKRLYEFEIEEESVKEMLKAGRIMPYLKISFQDSGMQYSTMVPATDEDAIYIFKEKKLVFILAKNSEQESIVLEVFKNGKRAGGIYLREEKMKAILGNRDLPATAIIKRLRGIFF